MVLVSACSRSQACEHGHKSWSAVQRTTWGSIKKPVCGAALGTFCRLYCESLRPQDDLPVSPEPPPAEPSKGPADSLVMLVGRTCQGNPFRLPGSRAGSDHQTQETPAAAPPPAELTEPAPVPVAAWQDAAEPPGTQADTQSTQREALAEDTTARTVHSEEVRILASC